MNPRRSAEFIGILGGLLLAVTCAQAAQSGNGNTAIGAVFPGADPPIDAVKLRYKMRMDLNQARWLYILFSGGAFSTPGVAGNQIWENDIFSGRSSNLTGPDFCDLTNFNPLFPDLYPFTSIGFSVNDYSFGGHVGLKTLSPGFWRTAVAIDGIYTTNANGQTIPLQALGGGFMSDLSGKTVSVEIERTDLIVDKGGWSPCFASYPTLDELDYRAWKVTATVEGVSHALLMAVPDKYKYFSPPIYTIWTEFIAYPNGAFRAYYWDFFCQREHWDIWEPLNDWEVVYHSGTPQNEFGFGFRRGFFEPESKSVIEVSNDPARQYLAPGERLSLGLTNVVPLAQSCPPFASARTNRWQLPSQFVANRLLLERCPDSRPGRGPGTAVPRRLSFRGRSEMLSCVITNSGPIYFSDDLFPYVLVDDARSYVVMHPSVAAAVSLGMTWCEKMRVRLTGAFARANACQWAGDGVFVGISLNGDTTNWLWSATIPSWHVVDPESPFAGAGTAAFDFDYLFRPGDVLRFMTFCGEVSSSDMAFDSTAFRLTAQVLSAPEKMLSWVRDTEGVGLQWLAYEGESDLVMVSADLSTWHVLTVTQAPRTDFLRIPVGLSDSMRFFRLQTP